jgi:hypothetical protein
MYCTKCGKNIPDDSVFCPECGYSLGKVGPAGPGPAGPAQAVSGALNIGIIAGSVILPLLGIVMGIIYLRDSNPDKQKAGKTWLWVGIGAAVFWVLYKLS